MLKAEVNRSGAIQGFFDCSGTRACFTKWDMHRWVTNILQLSLHQR